MAIRGVETVRFCTPLRSGHNSWHGTDLLPYSSGRVATAKQDQENDSCSAYLRSAIVSIRLIWINYTAKLARN